MAVEVMNRHVEVRDRPVEVWTKIIFCQIQNCQIMGNVSEYKMNKTYTQLFILHCGIKFMNPD